MKLFEPLALRGVTLRNRIGVSPMCEYSSDDGFTNDWHFVHLGSRAVGGAGLVFTEAAAVAPEGRISPQDLGIYKDEHVPGLRKIVDFIHAHGAAAGMQLAHAGFKASTYRPWSGDGPVAPDEGGWSQVVSSSAQAFTDGWIVPHALSKDEIAAVRESFVAAAKRALSAGFDVLEIHAAHGYLLHEFLSPLVNHRTDEYGGSFENRTRMLREVVQSVRAAMPDALPLFVRISASDWVEGGWTVDDSVHLARELKTLGVDVVDCSSGGIVPHAKIEAGPGYQVPFSRAVRNGAGVATAAVGMITDAKQAASIVQDGDADMVLLARELLRQPYWPLLAAAELGVQLDYLPKQYERAYPRRR